MNGTRRGLRTSPAMRREGNPEMQRLHLVAAEPQPTSVTPADLEHALEVLGAAPAGSDSDEALLLVEVMNARAARMAPGSHLRATLVRCVSALARCHGRTHLSPVRPPVERPRAPRLSEPDQH